MPRRPRGDGSIYQRKSDSRWVGALVVDGRRIERYADSRDEVRRKLDRLRADRNAGLPIVQETATVAQFAAEWLETMQPRIRPSTHRRYRELMELHVIPTLGKMKLAKLEPSHVQRLYSDKLAEGLSTTTVNHLHARLHKCLDAAVRLNLIQRNVSELVDVPRPAEHEMRVLLPEEIRALLAAAEDDRLRGLYVLALATGMRVGELLALKWRDVDLEPDAQGMGQLQVRATLTWQPDQGWVFSAPKTKRSRRRIKLPAAAVRELRAHGERQMVERAQMREVWHDEGLVFPNTIGTPLDRSWMVRQSFWPLLERAGLPRMRFHDLRHTAATMMLLHRVNPKVVSEVLGHASISITLDIYSHVLPDMQDDAARVMDDVLGSQVGERVLRQMAPRLLEGEREGEGES